MPARRRSCCIRQPPEPFHNLTRYATRFIGADGKVLAEVYGLAPRYRFRGDEVYVRASIVDSDGRKAWTQPFFPPASKKSI
jgi:hypothetical protein